MLPQTRSHVTWYLQTVTSITKSAESNLTIEQLAAEVKMSVRNIRNHHSRGLLPPPEVRARIGYYNGMRPHLGIGGRTPRQRLREKLAS